MKLSYKERERQRREQEILKTAARLINERGYTNISMDDIAEAVGVSKPTIYQHFKSKEDMVAGALIHSVTQMESFMNTIKDDPPVKQLELIMRYMLETHTSPDAFPMMMAQEQVLSLLELHPQVVAQGELSDNTLFHIVQKGQESGEITSAIHPVVIIGGMFSMIGTLRGPRIMHQPVDTETLIEGIVTLYINGISAPS